MCDRKLLDNFPIGRAFDEQYFGTKSEPLAATQPISSNYGNKSLKSCDSIDFHYFNHEFKPIGVNASTVSVNSSPVYVPLSTSLSSSTPFGQSLAFEPFEKQSVQLESMAVRDNTLFAPFDIQSSTSVPTPFRTFESIHENMDKNNDLDYYRNKIDFKILFEYLQHLTDSSQTFQTNILEELKQMKDVMKDLQKSIHEMPIKFADALTQCLDSANSRSDVLSVDSEPEIVDFFDKIDITNDCKEDNSFVDVSNGSLTETHTIEENSGPTVNRFVFEYNPYIDLDKWLKK